jgi:hypothetical protein
MDHDLHIMLALHIHFGASNIHKSHTGTPAHRETRQEEARKAPFDLYTQLSSREHLS